jgi:hypothetical protein
MMTIWMFCFAMPAARRIGRVYSQQLLGLGITDHRRPLSLRERRHRRHGERDRRGEGGQLRHFRAREEAEQHGVLRGLAAGRIRDMP